MAWSLFWKLLAVCAVLGGLAVTWADWSRLAREPAQPVGILAGHRYPVQLLAFSPDGGTLTATAYFRTGAMRKVQVTDWDVRARRVTARRTPYLGPGHCLTLAGRRRTLAAAGDDGTVWLSDADRPAARRSLSAHRAAVFTLNFSADGGRLATGGWDGADGVAVWDVAGGRRTAACDGPTDRVLALEFAPDGRTLAAGDAAGVVRVWDADTGQIRCRLRGHPAPVQALAFAPDGRALAIADATAHIQVWDLDGGCDRVALEVPPADPEMSAAEVTALAFAPDGRTLAAAIDRVVHVWDADTGRPVARLAAHDGKVMCLAFSPDGTLLASGGHDRVVCLWAADDYRPARKLDEPRRPAGP
jgi:WD40 repeat protein